MAQTWAHVQSRAATGGGSGTTQALAFTGNTTTGNLIVVACHTNNTTRTIASITDSQGNTYVQTQAAATRASHGAADVWYAKNIAGGTTPTVTVTFGASLSGVDTYTSIHEYSGLDTTAPLDRTAAANGTGAAPSSGNTAATTAADDLVFGFCYAGGTASAGSGFTSRQTVNGDLTEDKNQATLAAVAAIFTQTGGANPYIAMCATFKQATGGGTGHTKNLDDSIAGTDAQAKAVTAARADTIAGTDANAKTVTSSRADTITGTDARAAAVAHPVADSASAADAISKHPGPHISDNAEIDDSGFGNNASLSFDEALDVTDDIDTGATTEHALDLDDTITGTDARAKTARKAIADTGTVADARAARVTRPVSDTIAGTDSAARASGFKRTIGDTAALADHIGLPGTVVHPDPATPTSLVLDAHGTGLALAEHEQGLTLAEHAGRLVLDAHDAGLTLDEHARVLQLDA